MKSEYKHVGVPVAGILASTFAVGLIIALVFALQCRPHDSVLIYLAWLSVGAASGVWATFAAIQRQVSAELAICFVWWFLLLASLTLAILGVRRDRLSLGLLGAISVALLWLPPTLFISVCVANM